MTRSAWLLALALATLATGCVERRFVVNSNPSRALILHNGNPIGAAPADDHFTYYGDHDFTVILDGYETLHVKQSVPAPWYEYPPFDFVAEALIPWRIKDVRRFEFNLQPVQAVRADELLQRGTVLRERAKTIPGDPEGQNVQKPAGQPADDLQLPPEQMPRLTSLP
ncbi:MAG: hypothetical protein AB7K24_09685 [Gemmataceae bacterium]